MGVRGEIGNMNSLSKLTASLAALIASLAFAWLALTLTHTIPGRSVDVGVWYGNRLMGQ